MAHKINAEACVNCGACEPVCPVTAITEKDEKRIIDPAKCTDCEACVGVCPTSAIAK